MGRENRESNIEHFKNIFKKAGMHDSLLEVSTR